MKSKSRLLLFSSLIFVTLFVLGSINSVNASSDKIQIGAISAQGDITVNSTITLQVTVINTYSSDKIRDIGMALPYGLVNLSETTLKNVVIPGDSYIILNFTIFINSTGDFEILFFEHNGYGIGDWTTAHLLVESYPESLPIQIIINETVYIDEIPVTVYEEINVTNWLINNNYNNLSVLINQTNYNLITNNIINNITNIVVVNVINNYTQWQWQNVTVIVPTDEWGVGALYFTLGGSAIMGIFFMGTAKSSFEKGSSYKKSRAGIPIADRSFKFGLGVFAGVSLSVLLILGLPYFCGIDFFYAVIYGILAGISIFIIIMSLNKPITLLALLVPINVFLWIYYWPAGLIMLIVIGLIIFGYMVYSYLHNRYSTRSTSLIVGKL
jgi:hypothetical protein